MCNVSRFTELLGDEGTFYGVAILSDQECVLYKVTGAGDGNQAVEAIQNYVKTDSSLGVLFDGSSPVRDIRLVL